MKVSKDQLRIWANQINRQIFDYSLNIDSLKFQLREKDKRGIIACAWYYPEKHRIEFFNKAHKTEFEAFTTIAHELIHIAQKNAGFNNYKLNHGGKFFRYYADKICREYEIERKGF